MPKARATRGYAQLPVELFAALLAVPLTARARTVLAAAALQLYGPARAHPTVHLEPGDIERQTGLHRNNARRGVQELLDAGILIAASPGLYRICPTVASWTTTVPETLGRLTRSVRSQFSEEGADRTPSRPPDVRPINEHPNPAGLGQTLMDERSGLGQTLMDRAFWIGSDTYGWDNCSDVTRDLDTPCETRTGPVHGCFAPISTHPNPERTTDQRTPQSSGIGSDTYGSAANRGIQDACDDPLACAPAPARAVLEFNSSGEELNLAAAAAQAAGAGTRAAAEPPTDLEPGGVPAKVELAADLVAAVKEVRRAFGEPAAKVVWRRRERIGAALEGRWQAYTEAVHQAERELAEPGAEPIKNLHGFLLAVAKVRVERARRQGGAAIAVAPRPGSTPPPVPPRANARYREAGPPPPPLFPPPSADRIAEIERGYQRQAQANAEKFAPRRRPASPAANTAAVLAFQQRVRASGVQTSRPEPLTGT